MGENRLGLRAKQFYKHAPSVRKSARCKFVQRSREYGAANLHCQSMADSNSDSIGARREHSVERRAWRFRLGGGCRDGEDHPWGTVTITPVQGFAPRRR